MPLFEINRPPDRSRRLPLYVIRVVVGLVLFGLLTLIVDLAGGDAGSPKVLAAAVLAAFLIQSVVASSSARKDS
jgi:hypothetical protein